MAKKTQKLYIVRTGDHKGQYIGLRIRASSEKKYAWVKNRYDAAYLTLQQAKGIVRAYGGEIAVVA
jgi:hypothetical protein